MSTLVSALWRESWSLNLKVLFLDIVKNREANCVTPGSAQLDSALSGVRPLTVFYFKKIRALLRLGWLEGNSIYLAIIFGAFINISSRINTQAYGNLLESPQSPYLF